MKSPRLNLVASFSFFIILIVLSVNLLANEPIEMNFQEKFNKSDIVLIGSVGKIYTEGCLTSNTCALIQPSVYFKGKAIQRPVILFNGPIAEDDPICCQRGVTYLFFLSKAKKGFFVSTNGPFGVYKINVDAYRKGG